MEWLKWVEALPRIAREVAQLFNPWTLYCLKSTGQRVVVYSFADDGTMSVAISAKFNAVLFENLVFGINPNDLEECELPLSDECLGAVLSQEEVAENLEALRVVIRPDLWAMDDNGNAVRKQ